MFSAEIANVLIAKDRDVLKNGKAVDISEEEFITVSGEKKILHIKKIPIYNNSEQPLYLLGITEDITQRKKIEEQLAQTQKMESIGQLPEELPTISIMCCVES